MRAQGRRLRRNNRGRFFTSDEAVIASVLIAPFRHTAPRSRSPHVDQRIFVTHPQAVHGEFKRRRGCIAEDDHIAKLNFFAVPIALWALQLSLLTCSHNSAFLLFIFIGFHQDQIVPERTI